jgi:hypothetical protein
VRIAIPFVGDEAIWAGSRSPASAGTWDTDARQHGPQLGAVLVLSWCCPGAVLVLSWGDHEGERAPTTVTRQVELGRHPSAAASESLVDRMLDPFFHRPDWADDRRHSHAVERGRSN